MILKIAFYGIFGLLLGIAAGEDLMRRKICNMSWILILALGILRIWHIGFSPGIILNAVGSLLLIGGLMLIITAKTNGFGGGDIKLAAAGSLVLGLYPSILALLLSCVFFIAFWTVNKIQKEANTHTKLPFGPCYAVAAIITAIFCNI